MPKMQGRKTSLEPGEIVNNGFSSFKFLREASREDKEAYGRYKVCRCGWFKCLGNENHPDFIAPISRLLRGEVKYCPLCARERKKETQLVYRYEEGDYLDKNNRLMYIGEAEREKNGSRIVIVFDVETKEVFKTRLVHIISGRTTKSPEAVKQEKTERILSYKDVPKPKTYKYLPGDIIGPDKNILFMEELPARIENGNNHKRRMGRFKNIDTQVVFETALKSVVEGNTQGLQANSSGEIKIEKILKSLGIAYEKQKRFEDCINPKTQRVLPFDFFLPEFNICLEYDGEQHFGYKFSGWNTEENFRGIQERDAIKNSYCEDTGKILIRIPYTDFDKISESYILHLVEER